MTDHVPSVTQQGLDVKFITSDERCYNSGCFRQGRTLYFLSRRPNLQLGRCDIVLCRVNGDRSEIVRKLNLPAQKGTEQFEDPRAIWHEGSWYVAYTEGHYETRPWKSIQRLVRMNSDWTVAEKIPLGFGNNGGKGSEKNWQFFSRKGKLYFVYSIEPHVVVEVTRSGPKPTWKTSAGIKWPFGTLSGGTPPVLVKGQLVSFFHSYVRHHARHRRYSMSAYSFDPDPPFAVTGITYPILRASARDASLLNSFTPYWDPLVVFPCGALYSSGEWLLSAGINDSYDALIKVPHSRLHFQAPDSFAETKEFYFKTVNSAQVVRLAGMRCARWQPVGEAVGGVREGVFATTDPEIIAILDGRPGVTTISKEDYEECVSKK